MQKVLGSKLKVLKREFLQSHYLQGIQNPTPDSTLFLTKPGLAGTGALVPVLHILVIWRASSWARSTCRALSGAHSPAFAWPAVPRGWQVLWRLESPETPQCIRPLGHRGISVSNRGIQECTSLRSGGQRGATGCAATLRAPHKEQGGHLTEPWIAVVQQS